LKTNDKSMALLYVVLERTWENNGWKWRELGVDRILKKEINIRWICLVGDVWFAKLMKVNGWYVCQGRWKIWEKV
jgi:hypothetical protein